MIKVICQDESAFHQQRRLMMHYKVKRIYVFGILIFQKMTEAR